MSELSKNTKIPESTKQLIGCIICNKKSIYNMTCRCSATLCKRHWDPEKHNCKFDFAAHANNQNNTRLEKIETQKIEVI